MKTQRTAVSTIVLALFVCVSVSPVSAQQRFKPVTPQTQQATDQPAPSPSASTNQPGPLPTPVPFTPTDQPGPLPNPVPSTPIDPPVPLATTLSQPAAGITAPSPPSTTPLQALPAVTGMPTGKPTAEIAQKLLEEGNARFVAQQRQLPNSGLLNVQDTAKNGQHPFVTILSCGDSRVPLEIIFDRGIGDIFVIRVAGNVAGESETGSIEYSTEHVGTPLLVVLGHTKCGAVTAAATHAHTEGSLTKLIERILPAVDSAKKGNPNIKDEELIDKAVVENIWESIKTLAKGSEIIRRLVKEEKLRVVGAVYDIETGAVKWLGEHADMKKLVETVPSPVVTTPLTQTPTVFPAPTGGIPEPRPIPTPTSPLPPVTRPAQIPALASAPASVLTMELIGPNEVRWNDMVMYKLVVRNAGNNNIEDLKLELVQASNCEVRATMVDKLLPEVSKEIPIQVQPGWGRGDIDITVLATDSHGLKSEISQRIQVVDP